MRRRPQAKHARALAHEKEQLTELEAGLPRPRRSCSTSRRRCSTRCRSSGPGTGWRCATRTGSRARLRGRAVGGAAQQRPARDTQGPPAGGGARGPRPRPACTPSGRRRSRARAGAVGALGRLARLDAACAARGARTMLFAQDDGGRRPRGRLHRLGRARAYYLLGGGDPRCGPAAPQPAHVGGDPARGAPSPTSSTSRARCCSRSSASSAASAPASAVPLCRPGGRTRRRGARRAQRLVAPQRAPSRVQRTRGL